MPDLEHAVTEGGFLPTPGEPFGAVDAGRGTPGELMRLVADGLAAHGFEVGLPADAGDRRLAISCPEARCAVSVSDWGDVEWEMCPVGQPDPGRTADIATALLTGGMGGSAGLVGGHGPDCLTFKGIVGLELRARGFDVSLVVRADEDHFDVRAEIEVTCPSSPDHGAVHVTDDGCVTWTRDDWTGAATAIQAPGCGRRITDPVKLAAAVVVTITLAMSRAAPAGR